MESSVLSWHLATSQPLRQRIEALARTHLWDTAATDPRTPIPLDDLCWAVATNADIRQAVSDAMAAADDPDKSDAARAISTLGVISDAALDAIVTDALTRLSGPAQ